MLNPLPVLSEFGGRSGYVGYRGPERYYCLINFRYHKREELIYNVSYDASIIFLFCVCREPSKCHCISGIAHLCQINVFFLYLIDGVVVRARKLIINKKIVITQYKAFQITLYFTLRNNDIK